MSNEIQQELTKGVEILEKNIETFPPDSCERTVLGVVKHKEVIDAILKLLLEGYGFSNFECRDIGINPGQIFMVTIFFTCRPPKICIVHPRLEIIYDRPGDKVQSIRVAYTF
jgi:hypothetical protein